MSADDSPRSPMTVGVVGAGTMGAGIAQATLTAGHSVLLHDPQPDAVVRARGAISSGLDRFVRKGRLTEHQGAAAMGRLHFAADLTRLAVESDLVIEAAPEDLALKRQIFRALDLSTLPDVPLASNTSSLSVAGIGEAVHHRERVLGLHFFNPAPIMPLVEVVAGEATARSIIELATAFARSLDKTPVLSADAPGFIVNRVNRAFTLEPLRMLERGEASVASIDLGLEAAGYPMGPFRLMDLVGIDVNLAVAQSLFDAFGDAQRFRPSPVQAAMVAAGRLGQKSGSGFYRYSAGSPPEPLELPPEGAAPSGPALAAEMIVERVNLAIVNEAYRAVEERVAAPADVDVAMRLGAGHPEGPFERAGHLGLRSVIEGLRRQEALTQGRSGDQFAVAALLWQMATA
jgi:3-hydroxybutyryl-CoA dehydrogenase